MDASEKLCLSWNDFKDNITSSFGELREDQDFTDVTLACEEGKQVEAHKIILAASSPFFKDILKRNKHKHPLIYMRGLKSEDLMALIDFLYFGEANILHQNLESFLALAEELTLKGFNGSDNSGKVQEPKREAKETSENAPAVKKENEARMKREKTKQRRKPSRHQYESPTNSHTIISTESNPMDAKIQDLDDQIKLMMTKTDIRNSNAREYLFSCNTCGKQAAHMDMQRHIEAKHITGFSHACNICGKTSRSRTTSFCRTKHSGWFIKLIFLF